jgi:hypothetical protein
LFWEDERGVYAQRVDRNGVVRWPANGSPVLSNPTSSLNVCPDGVGGAFVVWGLLVGFDTEVRVQRVNSSGAPMWGATGVNVGVTYTITAWCGVVSDGASGVIVVWGSREGIGTYAVRGQHLDASGAITWAAGGIVVGSGVPHQLVADGEGGALVAWYKSSSASSSWTIRFQHVLSTGSIASDPEGRVVQSGSLAPPILRATSDGAHGAFLAWWEKDSAGTQRVIAQRVGPSGDLLWPSPGIELATSTLETFLDKIQVCPSGVGDVIVGWVQPEYPLETWLRAQRLNPTGSLAWPAGGVAVRRGGMRDLAMSADGADGALFAFTDVRGTAQDVIYSIAASRVTGGGAAPWGPTGVVVSTAYGYSPSISPDGAGGGFIAWLDWRAGPQEGGDVYAQNVQADGTLGGAVTAVEPSLATTWARVWPRPARDHVQLAFTSPGGPATVTIFDPMGRRVRDLHRGPVSAGVTQLRWDCLDASGAPVRSGLYLASVVAGGRETIQRIVFAR